METRGDKPSTFMPNPLPVSQTPAITRFSLSNDGVNNMLSAFETDTRQTQKNILKLKIPTHCNPHQDLVHISGFPKPLMGTTSK